MTTEVGLRPLPLRGIEADNLLGFLALLGALRALEEVKPEWRPRVSWTDGPWLAHLHLAQEVTPGEVAREAARGVDAISQRYDFEGRKNVGEFDVPAFRSFLISARRDRILARAAAAIAVEHPAKRDGGLQAAPMVFQHGQGWQHFLERLVQVTQGEPPARLVKEAAKRKNKQLPNLKDSAKIQEALFEPWKRADETDAFRWDPLEDQRYALRFDDPSAAGAAPTVHGANRLAGVGLLSFPCVPRETQRGSTTPGVFRDADGIGFVWPLWSAPLSLHGVERLLSHSDVLRGRLERVRALGVREILRARRVPNAKFMNVTRAVPWSGA